MARCVAMIQHFDLREIVLNDADVTIRPCSARDVATLKNWFPDEPDQAHHVDVREIEEFTTWPFMISHDDADAGFLQTWRMTNGTGGLEIFIAPEHRRKGVAARALRLMARFLRERLRWRKVTIEPHDGDPRGIACCEKAGFIDAGERRDDGDHSHIIFVWPLTR